MADEKHPVQFGKTAWEILTELSANESIKKKTPITPAMYVRDIVNRHINRKHKHVKDAKGGK